MTASNMLTYVVGSVPAATLVYLGSPTNDDAGALKYVLEDSITLYGGGATTEAQCTDLAKFNLIGRALFWQWAVEHIVAADFAPAQLGQSEYAAHVAEIKRLRDHYAALANIYGGAAIQLADTTFDEDPYLFPREADQIP